MRYYLLSLATNKNRNGNYFQTKGLPEGYTSKWFDEPDSMTKLTDDRLPDFTPDLKWELEETAILTDIISASNITATGFLMSEKAKAIFEKFILIDHKFHVATLIVNNQPIRYYYLQLVHRYFKGVDFDYSSFCVTDFINVRENEISILSSNDLIQKQEDLEFGYKITAEKLSIYDEYQALDLFYFPIIHWYVFISQRLLDELNRNKITGFKIKQQSIITD